MRRSRRMIDLNLGETTSGFDLERAVCNHGFFMMPPNKWIPSSKTLQRPLRLADSTTSVLVSISQPSSHLLNIQIHSSPSFSPLDRQAILDQVTRMLRITERDEENIRNFQNLHAKAKEIGFGRLFRSPTLFEDAVKSILLCNATWRRTLAMAGQLCELQAKLGRGPITDGKKRKRKGKGECELEGGNFPTAAELCSMSVLLLQKHFIGYRAVYIIDLAQRVQNGKIDLQKIERALSFPKIKGFGPFTTANVFMCLGLYDRLPIDTETIRHLKQVHGRQDCNMKTAEEAVKDVYDKYAPFQCLAYWMELVEYYESRFGKLSELGWHDYKKISGTTRHP